MAVMPYDPVREQAKRMWVGLAAAALLCAAITGLSGLALRLLSGFFEQISSLMQQLFF